MSAALPELPGTLARYLHVALSTGRHTAVLSLLRKGVDVNGFDERGRTPLMVAAAAGHGHVCRLLLEAGADRFAEDPEGRTAAMLARHAGHEDVLILLEPSPLPSGVVRTDPAEAAGTPTARAQAADENELLWEPEAESAGPPDDPSIRKRSAETQSRLAAHLAVDGSTEWSDAGVEPPVLPVRVRVRDGARRARLRHGRTPTAARAQRESPVGTAAPEQRDAPEGPDRDEESLEQQVRRALKLLSSPERQRDFARVVVNMSYQREFARIWFSLYGRLLSTGIDPETGVLLRALSARIRKVLERLGFNAIPIAQLLSDAGWQEAMSSAHEAYVGLGRSTKDPSPGAASS